MFFLKTFLKYFKHFVKVLTETSHTNIRGEQITPKSSWSLVFPLSNVHVVQHSYWSLARTAERPLEHNFRYPRIRELTLDNDGIALGHRARTF